MSQPTGPFENGDETPPSDRNSRGQFIAGNAGGPGNPRSQLARQLRQRLDEALHKACSPDRLLAAVDAVLKVAEAGDVSALKLLMERISGPPVALDVIERIEALEQRLTQERVA